MNEFIFLSDVIVIVGDLVDGLVTDLKDAVQPLQNLKSKHGVLYVTGEIKNIQKKNSGYEVKKMHYMIRICI